MGDILIEMINLLISFGERFTIISIIIIVITTTYSWGENEREEESPESLADINHVFSNPNIQIFVS